jgi:hypothetical protein
MAVLRRFGSLWRKSGWPERLFAFALVVYLALVWIEPASAWRSLAGLALTIFGLAAGIRLARSFVGLGGRARTRRFHDG